MAFSYSADDLKSWLRADPTHGAKYAWVLAALDKRAHKFEVEDLWGRDFDGTSKGVFVDNEAPDKVTAVRWASDALREWAAQGVDRNGNYFGEIARDWATNGYGTKHTANSCGTTVDFLYLFSGGASQNAKVSMYTVQGTPGHMGLFNLVCWIYADIWTATTLGVRAAVNIHGDPHCGCPGLHADFWEGFAGNDHDQTHHFAAYYWFGANWGTSRSALHSALTVSHDWDPLNNQIINEGDYYLGFTAADLGAAMSRAPSFQGATVTKTLLAPSKFKPAPAPPQPNLEPPVSPQPSPSPSPSPPAPPGPSPNPSPRPQPIPQPPTTIQLPRTYSVESGDSLTKIARKYYGDGSQWPKIYEANKAVIGKDPNRIFPKQNLLIPRL